MKSYRIYEASCFANDNDALIPELWAREALAVLMSNMVMGNLVNRQFESMVQSFGDVVNTSRPNDFSGKRKTDADSVVEQDAISPNIPVPLDQHVYVTFIIKDGEMSKALPDLVERYLEPAARELAEKVDQVVAGQAVRLATYTAGRLGEMDKTNADEFVLDAATRLDINRAPRAGRALILGPRAHQACLGADLFVSAEKRGDAGTALRTASLGSVYGLDAFMDQNISYVDPTLADSTAGTVTSAVAAGTTGSITVSIVGYEVQVGDYVVVEGDGEAYEVSAATTGAGDTTAVTVLGGTKHAWAASAVITAYETQAVNLVAGYAAGYSKEILIDGQTSGKELQAGQWLSFGTGGSRHSYTIISATTPSAGESSVLLDRPLESALVNDQVAFPGPAGGMNLALTRDAVALVVRPLALVPADTGARSFVASFDGLSMRVTMQYDSTKMGMRVTFDLLCGVAILDDRQAVVLYS